jgi:transcriptional regulator with XRE-family HTH domain
VPERRPHGSSPPGLTSAFGRVLRSIREEEGLSQEALAHACDRHRTYIGLLERGLRMPSLGTIFVLAKALNRSPSELVDRVATALPAP